MPHVTTSCDGVGAFLRTGVYWATQVVPSSEKGGWMPLPRAASTLVMALLLLCPHLPAVAATAASPTRQSEALAPQPPPAILVGTDGAEMLLVPAGEFIMGSDADEI